jgi:hypothetical protein
VIPVGFPVSELAGFDATLQSLDVQRPPTAALLRREPHTRVQVQRDDQKVQGDQAQEAQVAPTQMSDVFEHRSFPCFRLNENLDDVSFL